MRRSKEMLAALSALAVSWATFAWAQSPSSPPPPQSAPTSAAMPFMQLAGEADVFEITSSEIALMRSHNADVLAFASMLIQHHTETTNTVLTQAMAAGLLAPPAVLGAQKRAMLDALYAAPAAQFDRTYLEQQIPAHEQALALMRMYAANGDTPALREAASRAIPNVEAHLERARALTRG